VKRSIVGGLLMLAMVFHPPSLASAPPVYVALWFDTEDYILPQDDDAVKRLADMLTRLDVRATFKVVGEKARVLERRGRQDVIASLKRHDIGYHSNTHSQQPTIAVYLQNAGWDEGRAEFARREAPGIKDVERIFGVTPVAYGQPGSAWAPQTYPALRDFGIEVYLDEADHVGIDDQPFYFGGMLNVFKMRSNLTRMALNGGDSLDRAKVAFGRIASSLRTRGGGTISIYYHPNEWVQTEFWDAVNFSHGANPPREAWKRPGTRPSSETEKAFEDFEQYVQFIKGQEGVRFVTASELRTLYADRAARRAFTKDDLLALARSMQHEIAFQKFDDYAVSPAEAFALLSETTVNLMDRGTAVQKIGVAVLDGPTRAFTPASGTVAAPSKCEWPAFAQAVRDTTAYVQAEHRLPSEVWIGAQSIPPADYLASLSGAFETFVVSGHAPHEIAITPGRFTVDRYVAPDSVELWRWPIFPQGFHAPHLMELARLQAWTLKPALLHP
jgi:Polysaccharide deacetylase